MAKLGPEGTNLVYGTYLGGSAYEGAYGIAVDDSGHAYVVGFTGSPNFPTTPGAFQSSLGFQSGFVTKLGPEGTNLVYSTYLGNPLTPRDVAVDASGNAYVTGEAGGLPTTPGAFQTNNPGNSAFVTKMGAEGTNLIYSTYLGGSVSKGLGIAVDSQGNAYVTGSRGDDFPTTTGAFDTCLGRSFVTKVGPEGTNLIYSTYLGGTGSSGFGDTVAHAIAVDGSGNAYVTGETFSPDFPTTPGAFDTSLGGLGVVFGAMDAFVTKISGSNGPLQPDLSLNKFVEPYPVTQGSNLTYTLRVDNLSSAVATGVTLTDTLPPGVTFVSASSGCTHIGGTVTCDLGSVSNCSSAIVTIIVTPTTVGSITNIALVSANESDLNLGNNTVTAVTTVTPVSEPVCADLTGTFVSVVPKCKVKTTNTTCSVKGTMSIQNLGKVESLPSVLRYYLSNDATLDIPGDLLIQEVRLKAVKTTKPGKAKLGVKLARNVLTSNQYIIAVIDAANAVTECVETNNIVVFGPLPQ